MTPSRQGARRIEMALPTILELIGAVRDGDAQAVTRAVDLLDLPAAVVLLAAMVDDSRTPTDLLAWTEDLPSARQARARRRLTYRGRPLIPCGSHTAFNRHWANRETPCEPCATAEIAYQAARQIRRRATQPTEGAA